MHSGGVSLYCGSRLSPKFSLGGTLKSDMNWFRTRYTGSANQFVSQYRGSSSASVDLYFSLNDRLGFYVGPGLHLNYWHVGGGDDYSNVEPSGQLQVQWAPSNKSQFSVYGHYMSYAPGASQFSDVTLRQDELNWIAGNPALKNHHWMGATLIYLWMPRQNFRISNLICYDRQTKQVNYIFEPAPESMGGLIRRYMNGAAENMIKYQIDVSLQLFDSDLSLYVSPDWSYTKVSGPYAGHNSWLRFRSGASYTVSNCEFSFISRIIPNSGFSSRKPVKSATGPPGIPVPVPDSDHC